MGNYNIIEYKSPEDSLNIDDFFKTVGYAYLYKGLGEYVNQIPLKELTVSLFREIRPVKLLKELKEYGCTIQEYAPGIYYIEGLMIPIQIIATRELRTKIHPSLKILTENLERDDLCDFMECVNSFTEPGEKRNADAVLQVSISANQEKYDQIRRSDSAMCDALKELFKDELEESYENGKLEGRTEGRQEGENRLKILYTKLERDGRREELIQTLTDPEILAKLYKEYGI